MLLRDFVGYLNGFIYLIISQLYTIFNFLKQKRTSFHSSSLLVTAMMTKAASSTSPTMALIISRWIMAMINQIAITAQVAARNHSYLLAINTATTEIIAFKIDDQMLTGAVIPRMDRSCWQTIHATIQIRYFTIYIPLSKKKTSSTYQFWLT